MVLSVKDRYLYTPVFNGNDKLPASERVTVEIIRPTADEEGELSSLEIVRDISRKQMSELKDRKGDKKATEDGPQKTALRFVRNQNTGRILRDHIGKISNLAENKIDPNGKTTRCPITCGADLADSRAFGIKGLIDELCAEVLRDELEADEEKNSESASSST